MKPIKDKYICEPLSRQRQLASGLWIADRIRDEKKDNVARCLYTSDDLMKPGDIIHYKHAFGIKLKWNDKKMVVVNKKDIIAIETDTLKALGSMVIIRVIHKDKIRGIIVPDQAKSLSGEYWGDVIAVGPDYPDKDLVPGDRMLYMRNEGYKFTPYDTNKFGRNVLYAVKEVWTAARGVQ